MTPARFIALEGGDGTGKSTQAAHLARQLNALLTREPGGTRIGQALRAVLLDPGHGELAPRAEALLYAADRAQHVAEVIRPALEAGKIVVSDRFVDSSLAYQGLARGLGLEDVYEISKWAIGGTLPDLVLWLKVDPQTAFARLSEDRDRLEAEDGAFHDRVAAAYTELAEKFPDRFVVIDASAPTDEVQEAIIAAFAERCVECVDEVKPEDLPTSSTPVPR